jgi:CelD/BcsL family acetyltransferase involved in cellulose biosynthesis
MRALATQTIRDAGALAALLPEWWTLWRRAPQATPFQSPAWLMPWWDVFAPGQLCSIAIREDQRLVALAPLYLETGPLGLRLLPLGIGISDYCDLLIDPEYETQAGESLMSALTRVAPWEICEFTELAPDASALKLPSPESLAATVSEASAAPILRLPANIEDLADIIPRQRLRQVRRARNAAARRGETAIVVGDADNSEALLGELIRLHAARWNSRGKPGVFSDKRVSEFHTAALPGLMVANLARLYALMIGESIAGVYYGFLDRGRAYAYLQGYDPNSADESPGLIVVAYAIEQAIREGAHEFHFLRGDEPYKYEWGADRHRNALRLFVRNSAIVLS